MSPERYNAPEVVAAAEAAGKKECPHCGYLDNPKKALMCGLCGNVFGDAVSAVQQKNKKKKLADPSADKKLLSEIKRRDFAAEIRANRMRSLLLLGLFPIILVLIGWAVGVWFFGYPEIGILAAFLFAVIYLSVSWFGGNSMILHATSAITADSVRDIKLFNVVDEMRIASGLPMPSVHIIETDAMNAFATGRDPQHAAVIVTRGLMDKCNREELQAVVAHEMGHVRNLDIRFAMLVAALVGVIVMLSDVMKRGWWWG
ncbi:M48 family metalloprotease, partial [bacterium]|nr:M48 family metalloprotease [bacterium]